MLLTATRHPGVLTQPRWRPLGNRVADVRCSGLRSLAAGTSGLSTRTSPRCPGGAPKIDLPTAEKFWQRRAGFLTPRGARPGTRSRAGARVPVARRSAGPAWSTPLGSAPATSSWSSPASAGTSGSTSTCGGGVGPAWSADGDGRRTPGPSVRGEWRGIRRERGGLGGRRDLQIRELERLGDRAADVARPAERRRCTGHGDASASSSGSSGAWRSSTALGTDDRLRRRERLRQQGAQRRPLLVRQPPQQRQPLLRRRRLVPRDLDDLLRLPQARSASHCAAISRCSTRRLWIAARPFASPARESAPPPPPPA